MSIEIGDICRTNLSQPGGLVKVLDIKPYSQQTIKPMAHIEHLEDHPYGYEAGAKGWYMVEDLVFVRKGEGMAIDLEQLKEKHLFPPIISLETVLKARLIEDNHAPNGTEELVVWCLKLIDIIVEQRNKINTLEHEREE